MEIDSNISEILNIHKEKFINDLKKDKFIWDTIEESISDSTDDDKDTFFMMMYLQVVLRDHKIKFFINMFKNKDIDKKDINKFIYNLIKLNHKTDKKMFSWYEVCMFNIDIQDWDIATIDYVVI